MTDTHTQLRVKCLECDLHFIVCTEHPEIHNAKTLYCPECGQRNGHFFTWVEHVPDPIFMHVPGNAQPMADMNTVAAELDLDKLTASRPRKPK